MEAIKRLFESKEKYLDNLCALRIQQGLLMLRNFSGTKGKARQLALSGFGYRIFRFFIVATALTPDELLQRGGLSGEYA